MIENFKQWNCLELENKLILNIGTSKVWIVYGFKQSHTWNIQVKLKNFIENKMYFIMNEFEQGSSLRKQFWWIHF